MSGLTIRQGANLPHWTREGATYAVTFRLADSLPQSVLQGWIRERDDTIARARQTGRNLSKQELARLDRLHSGRVEVYLDAGVGKCWLRQEPIARIVHDALFHFEGARHRIFAWCIMPNHVHVVARTLEGFDLPKITHGWKGFSGKEANKLLRREGPFWQPEPYDHLVRDGEDFDHCVRYALNNPTKAGLTNWKWVGTERLP